MLIINRTLSSCQASRTRNSSTCAISRSVSSSKRKSLSRANPSSLLSGTCFSQEIPALLNRSYSVSGTSMVQNRMQAVLQTRAITHQRRAPVRQSPQALRFRIRLPHPRQILTAQQLRQHLRIHLVRFDLGLGNGSDFQRVADHDFFHKRTQDPGHCPGIGGGFHRQPILTAKLPLREGFQGLSCNGNGVSSEPRSILEQNGEDRCALVDITTDEA